MPFQGAKGFQVFEKRNQNMFFEKKGHHAGSGKTSCCIYSIRPSISDCLSALFQNFPRTNAGQRGFPLSFKPLCLVSPSPIHRRQATIDKAMNWHTVMLGRICLMCSAQLWTITWSPVAPRCRAKCMCQPVGFGPYKHFQRPDSSGPKQGSTNRLQESL